MEVLRADVKKDMETLRADVKKDMEVLRADVRKDIGEVLEQNIIPILDDHTERLEKLESSIVNLPDKDYLDEKLNNLKGDLIVLVSESV